MKNKKQLVLIFINLALIITIITIIVYPRELNKIIGGEPNIDSSIHLVFGHRDFLLDEGTLLESDNPNDSKKIVEFLKGYKYIKSNTNYKKLDELEYYIIEMKDNKKQVFRGAIRGDKYLSVIDKNGRYSLYKVQGNKFDMDFLREYYNDLNKK